MKKAVRKYFTVAREETLSLVNTLTNCCEYGWNIWRKRVHVRLISCNDIAVEDAFCWTVGYCLRDRRRAVPYCLQADYKLHEFNKRLQHKADKKVDQSWWDELIGEFFEDNATLLIQFKEKSHARKYNIHRRLIPRYFRSLFEGNVTKVHFLVLESKENYVNSSVTLDCKHASMITHYGKPSEMKVQTDGHLSIEFTFDEYMRIRSWKFNIKDNMELVPKSSLLDCKTDQTKLEELAANVTEHGFSKATLQYLRLGVILQPMQEIMSFQKSFGMTPRDAFKSVLVEKWQAQVFNQGKFPGKTPSQEIVAEITSFLGIAASSHDFEPRNRAWTTPTTGRGRGNPPRKRKPRKPSTDSKPGGNKKKPSTSTSSFPVFNQSDVMLVNEPMIMGGKCGEEDERVITRLENSQFTSSNNGPTTDDVDETFAPSGGSASARESFTPSGGMELPVSTASQPWKNETATAVKDEKKE